MLDFGDYTVEVVTSLHSRNAGYSVGFARRTCGGPTQAGKVQDLPEGDTLAYQLTARGGPSVFFIGASDFVERNLAGLAPDAAMITVPNTDVTHAYVPRLLAALDWPATVVPVHWDHLMSRCVTRPRSRPTTRTGSTCSASPSVRARRVPGSSSPLLNPIYV